jgi:signal transduction histidine kinase
VPTTEAFYDRAIHPDDRDAVEAARRTFQRSPNERVEYEYRTHPDAGAVRWIRSEAYVHAGPTGDPQTLVGLATDVTRLKRRERELERRNERLDEFVSVASHDLRNPLNVAIGALELARDECDCDNDQFDAVARAHERMRSLVEDLLTLARGSGTLVETEPLGLADLAERCWETVQTADATLAVEGDLIVRADESRLRQLLENLLSNAVEHGSTSPRSGTREDAAEHGSTSNRTAVQSGDAVEHGSADATRPDGAVANGGEGVRITVAPLDGGTASEETDAGERNARVGFYVEDDGPGIPPAERDRVFDEGYSTATAGTGFGLHIVREVADAHGWDVTVAEGTDGGARFEITGVTRGE